MPKIPDSILKKMAARPHFEKEEWVARAFLGSKCLGISPKNVKALVKAHQKVTGNKKAGPYDVVLHLIKIVSAAQHDNTPIKLAFLDYDADDDPLEQVNDVLEHHLLGTQGYLLLIDCRYNTVYIPLTKSMESLEFLPERFECHGLTELPEDTRNLNLFSAVFTEWANHFVAPRISLITLYITDTLNA